MGLQPHDNLDPHDDGRNSPNMLESSELSELVQWIENVRNLDTDQQRAVRAILEPYVAAVRDRDLLREECKRARVILHDDGTYRAVRDAGRSQRAYADARAAVDAAGAMRSEWTMEDVEDMTYETEDPTDPHKAGMLECGFCGHQHVAVWPVDIENEINQECPSCGKMECGPVHDIKEGGPCCGCRTTQAVEWLESDDGEPLCGNCAQDTNDARPD